MAMLACVSQIPYVLALGEVNIVGEFAGDTYIRLIHNWKYWAGIFGLLLLLLYVFRKYRYLQIVAGIVWSIVFYGVIHWNYTYAGFAAVAFILLIFYSGQKGKGCRKAFYWFYPIHLLLLGCVNVFYVLK